LYVATLIALLGVVAAGVASRAEEPKQAPRIDAKSLATMVQHFDKVEKHEFSWGWIRWLMNSKLDPDAEMTFGIVQLNAEQANPPHVHANCEEHLYVLSGSCEHWLGEQKVVLKAGDVIRIPRGVSHKARTVGNQPMKAIIVYSSGDRQFEIVDEQGATRPAGSQ
jgi:mannose-6-phosphate isomerase-like protein (cupin superfamily)